jgi:HSP20 family molecular chaperone IbpA
MSQIAITRIQSAGAEAEELNADWQALNDRIRARAFAISQQRDGCALDHWLEAERDLTVKLESNLVENDSEYELSLAAYEFKAGNLNVTALPWALVIRGGSERTLFARFELPDEVDVEQVTAGLYSGTLRINAPKARPEKRAAGSEKASSAKAAAA